MGFCTGRAVILALCIALLIVVIFLLSIQLKQRGIANRGTYRRLKTWLLILLALYAIDNVIRYTFYIVKPAQFLPILLVGFMLHSLIIYLISFHYVEKTLHLSDDTQMIKSIMIYSLVGLFLLYLAIWIYDFKSYIDVPRD